MGLIQHVLLATDFGPASERARDTAIEFAEKLDATLTVLHVLEPPPMAYVGGPVPVPIGSIDTQRAVAVKDLGATVADARKCRPGAQGVMRTGTPWTEIVAGAHELHTDLVVVGSHGRRGLPHRLLGSVAERVVRLSSVPVLTVHGYWFDDRAQAGRELRTALSPLRERSPAVVAISRGGVVVGSEIAGAWGTSVDLLLTRDLEVNRATVGAACEDGTTHLAPGTASDAGAARQRTKLLSGAPERLREEAMRLRGHALLRDIWQRGVIVVSDAFLEPWRPLAAAEALAKAGLEPIAFAAPIATEQALAALRERFSNVIVLHTLGGGASPSAAYRSFRTPSERSLIKLLQGAATTIAPSV